MYSIFYIFFSAAAAAAAVVPFDFFFHYNHSDAHQANEAAATHSCSLSSLFIAFVSAISFLRFVASSQSVVSSLLRRSSVYSLRQCQCVRFVPQRHRCVRCVYRERVYRRWLMLRHARQGNEQRTAIDNTPLIVIITYLSIRLSCSLFAVRRSPHPYACVCVGVAACVQMK